MKLKERTVVGVLIYIVSIVHLLAGIVGFILLFSNKEAAVAKLLFGYFFLFGLTLLMYWRNIIKLYSSTGKLQETIVELQGKVEGLQKKLKEEN